MATQITLREVAQALQTRLGLEPIKSYWRETKPGGPHGPVQIDGVELKFYGATPEKVRKAMKGLEQTEKRKFKRGRRSYRWLMRWTHKSSVIKFRVTLLVDTEANEQLFIFTTTW